VQHVAPAGQKTSPPKLSVPAYALWAP